MSAATTYAPDRIGYRYGTPDSAYSKGYHRGQDVRLRGPYGSLVTQVDAIDDGVVVYVGRPNGLLAWTVVIDTGRAKGRYESHSHMADISVGVGQRVSSGDRLGRNAKMSEDRGFIDGVHDHVTITDRFDGAWVTWLDEYDPLPFMQAAYARATQGGSAAGNINSGGSAAGSENDMALDQDDKGYLGTEFNSIVKQITDAVTKAVGGVPAQVWAQPIQAQDANGRGVTKDGKPVAFRADGFAASSNAQIAALREVIATLAIGQGLDPAAITKAAEEGARKALQGLTLKAS